MQFSEVHPLTSCCCDNKVGDLLREMLLNEDSENAGAFNTAEKSELIFQLFSIIAVGGTMCQPDDRVDSIMETTKLLYKDLVTIYKYEYLSLLVAKQYLLFTNLITIFAAILCRDSQNGDVKISTQAALVHSVSGSDLFMGADSSANRMIVVVDPLKRLVYVVRTTLRNYW